MAQRHGPDELTCPFDPVPGTAAGNADPPDARVIGIITARQHRDGEDPVENHRILAVPEPSRRGRDLSERL